MPFILFDMKRYTRLHMGTLHRGLIVALKSQQQSRACSINTSTVYRLTQSGFYRHADFNQFDGILELPLLQNNGSLVTISLVNNHILNIVYPPRTPESPLSSFHLEFSDILL